MTEYVTFYKLSKDSDVTIKDFYTENKNKIHFNNKNYNCFASLSAYHLEDNNYMYMCLPLINKEDRSQGIRLNMTQIRWIKDKGFVKFDIIKKLTEKESKTFYDYVNRHKHLYNSHIFIRIDLSQFITFKDFFLKIHLFRFMYESYGAFAYIQAVEEFMQMSKEDKKGVVFKDVLLYNICFKTDANSKYGSCHSSFIKISYKPIYFKKNLLRTKEYIELIKTEPESTMINGKVTSMIMKNEHIFKNINSEKLDTFVKFNNERKKYENKN